MMTKLEFSTWNLQDANPASVAAFVAAGVLCLVARVLAARDFTSIEEVMAFAALATRDLSSPHLLDGMDAALERLARAVARGERVLMHGDFDDGGVTSTAILMRGMDTLGIATTVFIPDRATDGHSFKRQSVERACETENA